ncbi:unnamed protein product [Allacma fusca]|uniref:Uncharacterized protein n=1 Tax=Allacma fusca TaxID=39272 RepID=A0A8J2K300_9HEXA|nr:unnamed protein product [Allacma fusca]
MNRVDVQNSAGQKSYYEQTETQEAESSLLRFFERFLKGAPQAISNGTSSHPSSHQSASLGIGIKLSDFRQEPDPVSPSEHTFIPPGI